MATIPRRGRSASGDAWEQSGGRPSLSRAEAWNRMVRRLICSLILVLVLIPLAERPAYTQVRRAAVGAAAGVGGGAVVTLSLVMARARFQRKYLDSAEDLVHWQTTPMIVAPAVGLLFGYASEDALRASVKGSIVGMLAGAAVGSGLGVILADDRQAPWAYGLIAAGLGLTVGGVVQGSRAWSADPDATLDLPKFLRFNVRLPVR